VNDTETGRLYYDLTKKQNEQQEPFYRDPLGYTPDYMIELARRASQAFGWHWFSDHYDTSVTARLHKDLENYVGKLGFSQIPEEYDQLLYDLHHCLHAVQFGKSAPGRSDNLQIEWLTDTAVPLPASFKFEESSSYGDLILINPYVGHNPLQIYRENDYSSLATTCRFHDVVKPGIVVTNVPRVPGEMFFPKQTILEAFIEHDPDFVHAQGADKILYYAGAATIGRVTNIDVFDLVKHSTAALVLDRVEFYD
jgi:hypothetical protein